MQAGVRGGVEYERVQTVLGPGRARSTRGPNGPQKWVMYFF
jgi:hypothetical protein